MEAVGCLFPRRTAENGNRIWVILPTAFGTGVLMLTWAVYIISWMFSVCAGAEHPLFYGNLLVMTVATLVLAVLFKKKKKNIFPVAEGMLTRKWILRKDHSVYSGNCICYMDDVLCFSYERWNFVFRFFCIWGLCTAYGDDEIFFQGK